MFYREIIELETSAGVSFTDITQFIVRVVLNSGINEGICHVSVTGTTASILVNENDRFLVEDFKRFFKAVVDEEKFYSHPENAFSHIRAALLNTEKTVPVAGSRLILGRWQSIMLLEFDTKARKRQIVVTVIGE